MSYNFDFTDFHHPPMPKFSSLPWLDPRLSADAEITSKSTTKGSGTTFQQYSGHPGANLVPAVAPNAVDTFGLAGSSSAPTAPGILVTERQFASHQFLMTHSPQYMGLLQAYMDANSELRALRAISTCTSSSRMPPLSSRANSMSQSHHNPKTSIKKTSLPATTTLPPLKKEDYPNAEVMWSKKAWSANVKNRKNQSTKISPYDFLRDEEGVVPDADTIEEMRDTFKKACHRLDLAGLRPRKWRKCVPEALKYVRDTLCAAYPVFRYANNDWKVNQFATRVYPDWNRNYESDADSDVAPKKRKRHHVVSDSSSSDSDDNRKKDKPKKKKPATTKDMGKDRKAPQPKQPLPPTPLNTTPSDQHDTAANIDVVASVTSPPPTNTSESDFTCGHPPAGMITTANPSADITPSADIIQTDPPLAASAPPINTAATNPLAIPDITPISTINPKGFASGQEGRIGSRRLPTRSARPKMPNPLSGLDIPKPAEEVSHSETAPEVRTRGGSKVMEPHPTHLSAKNMFAFEIKKKNPEITQDEFNTMFEKLTPKEKKVYDKLGKERKAALKKDQETAAGSTRDT